MSSKKRADSMSEEERQKHVAELKERIQTNEWKEKQPVDPADVKRLSDHDYYRFLKARNFKQDDAFKMLANYLVWRKEMGVTEIKRDHIKDELALKKTFFYQYDRDGRLVVYVRVGMHKVITSFPHLNLHF
jgi:hypothetical protein